MSNSTEKLRTFELQGVAVDVVFKGAGPQLFVLHGGGGPVVSMPFADALSEKF